MIKIPVILLLTCFSIIACDAQQLTVNPYLSSHFSEKTFDSLISLIGDFVKTQDSTYIIRNGEYTPNPCWLKSDFDYYRIPFFYFMGASRDRVRHSETNYEPVLLSISKEMEYDDYLARIAYVGQWDSVHSYINHINAVAITRDSTGAYKLKYPIDMLTKYWRETKVGRITYKINHNRVFDVSEARRMDSFNTAIAKYFHVPPCEFMYYSCKTYQEMWKTLGVEFNQAMYANDNSTGGYTLHYAKRIISGNNSEYYPHELIHIYTNIIYSGEYSIGGMYNRMADEGIATYFGGSREKSLMEHLENLAAYIDEKGIEVLDSLIDLPTGQPGNVVRGYTDIYYAVGGLMSALVDKRAGYKGLIELLTNTKQSNMLMYLGKLYGLPEDRIGSFLMNEIEKYRKE